MDLIWVMGFGERELFLDTIEILWLLESKTQLVNSASSLMFLSNKYVCSGVVETIESPKSYISADANYLIAKVREDNQRSWIMKPPAESMGRAVFKLSGFETNTCPLIEFASSYRGRRYLILQEDIGKTKGMERRVLMVDGRIVLSYERTVATGDHRANLHVGGTPSMVKLRQEEIDIVERAAKWCSQHGARFIGIDLMGELILEINVVNPGGLATYFELSGVDLSSSVMKSICILDS